MFAILLSDVTSLYLVICAYCGVQCGRTRRGARARPAHGVLADCTPRSVRQAEGRKAGAYRADQPNHYLPTDSSIDAGAHVRYAPDRHSDILLPYEGPTCALCTLGRLGLPRPGTPAGPDAPQNRPLTKLFLRC